MAMAGWAAVSPNGEQRPEMEARSNRGWEDVTCGLCRPEMRPVQVRAWRTRTGPQPGPREAFLEILGCIR